MPRGGSVGNDRKVLFADFRSTSDDTKMMGIRKLIIVLLAATCVLYFRAFASAIVLGTNSMGLISLASKPMSDHTLNPLSEDVSFISPNTAEWILTTFDWPYRASHNVSATDIERIPEIHAATTFWGVYSDGPDVKQRMLRLMEHFIDRGASVEQRYMGLTPLHEAVMSANAEAAKFLIERGADPLAIIYRPGRKHDGLNSIEFARLLYDKEPESMKDILAVIQKTENTVD